MSREAFISNQSVNNALVNSRYDIFKETVYVQCTLSTDIIYHSVKVEGISIEGITPAGRVEGILSEGITSAGRVEGILSEELTSEKRVERILSEGITSAG